MNANRHTKNAQTKAKKKTNERFYQRPNETECIRATLHCVCNVCKSRPVIVVWLVVSRTSGQTHCKLLAQAVRTPPFSVRIHEFILFKRTTATSFACLFFIFDARRRHLVIDENDSRVFISRTFFSVQNMRNMWRNGQTVEINATFPLRKICIFHGEEVEWVQ